MRQNKKLILGMFFVVGVLLMISFSSAYVYPTPQYTPPGLYTEIGTGFMFDQEMCKEVGQDLIVQIAPFGCVNAPVRSDLLEEQDVPVFCQLSAVKINPLIDIEKIDRISFTGEYSREIKTIGFHPARAALGVVGGRLNNPTINNIGYVVIMLRRQPNETAMPEFVEGNLTARIKYDIKNAWGVGDASYYLPELSDEEFEDKFIRYGFWDGRGYLKADAVDETGATISVYSDTSRAALKAPRQLEFIKRKIASVSLREGETSHKIYIPGLGFCMASLKLKLNNLEAADTRAKLKINADIVEVAEMERFLDNKCYIIRDGIEKQGIIEKVRIRCEEDERPRPFELEINPKIKLSIDGAEREVSTGDLLYKTQDDEKAVYVGYIGTKEDSSAEEDLYVYFFASPQHKDMHKNELTEKDIDSIETLVRSLIYSDITGIGLVDFTANVIKAYGGLANLAYRFIGKGETIARLDYKTEEPKDIFGKQVSVVGFAEPVDVEISGDDTFRGYYENANEDYDAVIQSFSSEINPDNEDTTLGEEALYAKISLLSSTGQKRSVAELCHEFKEAYPDSDKNLNICEDKYKLSSSEFATRDVLIDNQVKTISFEGIYEPTFDDYGAVVLVRYPDGKTRPLRLHKNKITYLNEETNEFIQLIRLEEDFAIVNIETEPEGILEEIEEATISTPRERLDIDIGESVGGYVFTLGDVNLKRFASVSVISGIDYAGTEADFSFKIGIEKRAISLAPDKIEERIEKLDRNIAKWQDISDKLGTSVKALKTACLGVGTGLIVKNFFADLGGKGIARQKIMHGIDGWNNYCRDEVNAGNYVSLDQCFLNNSDAIDAEVERIYDIIKDQNKDFKKLRETSKEKFLIETFVNADKRIEKYSPQVQEFLRERFGDEFVGPDGKVINMTKMITSLSPAGFKKGTYTMEQIRDMELYAKVLESEKKGSDLYKKAEKRLYSLFADVQKTSEGFVERTSFLEKYGLDKGEGGFISSDKDIKTIEFSSLKTYEEVKGKFEGVVHIHIPDDVGPFKGTDPKDYTPENDEYVYIVTDVATNKEYLLMLTDSYVVDRTFEITKEGTLSMVNTAVNYLGLAFTKFDRSKYNNKFVSSSGDSVPLVRYYETQPYKGFPAIVPIDLDEGWYVAMKSTLPIFGRVSSFDAFGRPSSFYLCNVGENGREEFFSGIGDDICQGINLGTRQTYAQFGGLSPSETSRSVERAIGDAGAVEQAQRQHSSGVKYVSIFGKRIKVGSPATEIPDIQCQDFMSPKDCNLIFNLCDPVICPPSRCNFGGAYHVKDVIQSGIAGSIALCLPNWYEGIYVPVCLTGVKAGIDSWLSIGKSYRDCLREKLETGKTIGICDEIYSFYVCDFFWRQSLPLAKIAIPKIASIILGQNLRGGGEYLGVMDAWTKAEGSINYFTQYYAANSMKAFKARSTEELAGEAFCKVYSSLVLPKGNLIDALTEPDSPPQFHGRFDEIPFTTVTSPPVSHYKVFYHIYAGSDRGAYYRVYLRPGPGGSFYQDIATIRMVATGYIPRGEYASDTPDFTAPSGYKELCINVNEYEECGFKEVSTAFAVNYIKDHYLAEQAKQKQITTEQECVSGSALSPFLLNPNIQSIAEEAINPAIYDRGLIRICATDNPGKGTDASADMEGSRWVDVGYCGNVKMRCWLDTQSVKDIIKTTTIEEEAVKDVQKSYVDVLTEREGYLDKENFGAKINEINKEATTPQQKINIINEIIDKVFLNQQKAYLHFLRGNAYADLAIGVYERIKAEEPPTEPGEEPTDKEGFVYPIFEFQDGTSNNNLYYRYFNEEWHWSFDPEREEWESVAKADVGLPSPEAIDLGAGTFERLEKYEANISKLSARYGIDKNIVKAIIVQESRAESDVTDKRGSYGLMQVSEIAAKDVKQYYTGEEYDEMYERFVEDINEKPYETYLNIHLGIAYYKKLLDHYGKNNSAEDLKKITLAAYNWGPTNIDNICDGNRWRNCEGIPSVVSQYVSNVVSYENFFIVYPSPKASTKLFEKDIDFIGELTGKSYIGGLRLLIQRTTADEEGGWFFNPKLSTEKVEMNSNGRFIIKLKGELDVYIRWDWEYESWIYREEARFPELIENLTGKDLDEGAEFLFALNFEEGIETPLSAEEEEEEEEEGEEEEAEEAEEEPTPTADVSKEFEVFPKEKEVEKSAEFKIVTEYPYEFEWRAISTGDVSRRGVVEKGEGKTFDVSELESVTAVTLDIYELKKTLFFFTNKISRGHFSWRIVDLKKNLLAKSVVKLEFVEFGMELTEDLMSERITREGTGFFIKPETIDRLLIISAYHTTIGHGDFFAFDSKNGSCSVTNKNINEDISLLIPTAYVYEGITGEEWRITTDDYPALILGDSDEIEIGDELFIFGYPKNSDIVSERRGRVLYIGKSLDMGDGYVLSEAIVLDISVEKGFSGSPVFNSNGKVVGVIVAADTFIDGAVATSINTAKESFSEELSW